MRQFTHISIQTEVCRQTVIGEHNGIQQRECVLTIRVRSHIVSTHAHTQTTHTVHTTCQQNITSPDCCCLGLELYRHPQVSNSDMAWGREREVLAQTITQMLSLPLRYGSRSPKTSVSSFSSSHLQSPLAQICEALLLRHHAKRDRHVTSWVEGCFVCWTPPEQTFKHLHTSPLLPGAGAMM